MQPCTMNRLKKLLGKVGHSHGKHGTQHPRELVHFGLDHRKAGICAGARKVHFGIKVLARNQAVLRLGQHTHHGLGLLFVKACGAQFGCAFKGVKRDGAHAFNGNANHHKRAPTNTITHRPCKAL